MTDEYPDSAAGEPSERDNDSAPPHPGTGGDGRGPRPGDIGLILGAAAVLVAIHIWLPPGIRERLALRLSQVALPALVSSAYVHLTAGHLTGNLVGYLVGSLTVYWLAIQADRVRWFRTTFVLLLTVVPVAVNLVTIEVYDAFGRTAVVSRGFSGVVAGIGGASIVALTGFLGRRYDRWVTRYSGGLITLTVLGEMLYLVADPVPAIGIGTLSIGLLVVGSGLLGRWRQRGLPSTTDAWLRVTGDTAVVVGVVLVLSWFVLGLFPTQPLAGDRITNVVAHAVGGTVGGLLALVVYALVPPETGSYGR